VEEEGRSEDCSPDGRDTRRSAAGSMSFNMSDIASNHEGEPDEETVIADAIYRLLRSHLDRLSPELVMRTFETVRREASAGVGSEEKGSLRLMPSVATWYHSLPTYKRPPASSSTASLGSAAAAATAAAATVAGDTAQPAADSPTSPGTSPVGIPDMGSSPTSSCLMTTSDDAIPCEAWRHRARSRITTMRSVVTTMRLLSAPHHAIISDLSTASVEDLKELAEAAKQLTQASNKVLDGVSKSEGSSQSLASRAAGRATVSFAPIIRTSTSTSQSRGELKKGARGAASSGSLSKGESSNHEPPVGDEDAVNGSSEEQKVALEEQEQDEEDEEEEVETTIALMSATATAPHKVHRLGQGADQVALRHLLRAAALVQDMLAPLQASGQLPGFLSRSRFMRKGRTFQELTVNEGEEICSCMEGCASLCTQQAKIEKGEDPGENGNSEEEDAGIAKLPLPDESKAKLGRCETCNQVYAGHGRICASCRKGRNQPIVRPCVGCGAFYVGQGSQCEDCLTPPREAGLKLAASSLKTASETLRKLLRSSSAAASAWSSASSLRSMSNKKPWL